jgi:hypothetical protein
MIPEFKEPVDGALWALERGFKVFPLRQRDKLPAVKDWQDWASESDAEKVMLWASTKPNANWGLSLGASGHTVVDVDDGWKKTGESRIVLKEGKAHLSTLLKNLNSSLGKTLVVKTASGGLHVYYKGDGRNSASTLCADVDTRGRGGYVLAPGSVVKYCKNDKDFDGSWGSYQIVNDDPIAILPQWVSDKLGEQKAAEKTTTVLAEKVPSGQRNQSLASMAGTLRARGCNAEVLSAALHAFNRTQFSEPLADCEVDKVVESIARYAPTAAKAASDFLAAEDSARTIRRVCDINPDTIPRREWVLKNAYLSRFISVIVSPGGLGKSTVTMLDALSVASGQPLSGFEVVDPGPVLIYNAEDPLDELERRSVAMAAFHDLPLATLDNVYLMSGRRDPLVFAAPGDNRETVLNEKALDEIAQILKERGIKLWICDPVVRTHHVNENDNMAMDKVIQAFQRVAEDAGCAVCLVHHTSKAASTAEDTASSNLARGASSLRDAARVMHTLTPMRTVDEATKAGVNPARLRWYFKRENAKANFSAPTEFADWYERGEVHLPNGEAIGVCRYAALRKNIEDKQSLLDNEIVKLALALPVGEVCPFRAAHPHGLANAKAKPDVQRALGADVRFMLVEGGVIKLPEAEANKNAGVEAAKDFLC